MEPEQIINEEEQAPTSSLEEAFVFGQTEGCLAVDGVKGFIRLILTPLVTDEFQPNREAILAALREADTGPARGVVPTTDDDFYYAGASAMLDHIFQHVAAAAQGHELTHLLQSMLGENPEDMAELLNPLDLTDPNAQVH